MNKIEEKSRKTLNKDQLLVLELLLKFRFGSHELIARYFNQKSIAVVYSRLKILHEQGYVGKRFDSSYRLLGKPAAYYLTPKSARKLQESRDQSNDNSPGPINVISIYKDKTVSEFFISHCLNVFNVYINLKTIYSNNLSFYTKPDLVSTDYFPVPLYDAYLTLDLKQNDLVYQKQFFLEIIHETQPFFKVQRRIQQYIDFGEQGTWAAETGMALPTLLLVCDSSSLQKRVQKRAAKMLTGAWDDEVIATTLIVELGNQNDVVWQVVSEPDEKVQLSDI